MWDDVTAGTIIVSFLATGAILWVLMWYNHRRKEIAVLEKTNKFINGSSNWIAQFIIAIGIGSAVLVVLLVIIPAAKQTYASHIETLIKQLQSENVEQNPPSRPLMKPSMNKPQSIVAALQLKKDAALLAHDTAQILKDTADLDAERIKTLAEADEVERKARIAGDGGMTEKLAAEIEIQKVWAKAFSQRRVPESVYTIGGGSGGSGGPSLAADSEVKDFMNIMTIDAAKRMNYDRTITNMDNAKAVDQ